MGKSVERHGALPQISLRIFLEKFLRTSKTFDTKTLRVFENKVFSPVFYAFRIAIFPLERFSCSIGKKRDWTKNWSGVG